MGAGDWQSGIRQGPTAPPEQLEARCSFCGKPQTAVRSLICGPRPSVAICNECVELCRQINAEANGDGGRGG